METISYFCLKTSLATYIIPSTKEVTVNGDMLSFYIRERLINLKKKDLIYCRIFGDYNLQHPLLTILCN
jgi:hypothetical protein